MSGTCRAEITTSGAACDATLFSGNACDYVDDQLVCGPSRTCVQVVRVPLGMPCGVLTGGVFDCNGGSCIPDAPGASTGTCAAFLDDYAPCDTSATAPRCAPPSTCVVPTVGDTTGICRGFDPRYCG
jgi:hypothetical protein